MGRMTHDRPGGREIAARSWVLRGGLSFAATVLIVLAADALLPSDSTPGSGSIPAGSARYSGPAVPADSPTAWARIEVRRVDPEELDPAARELMEENLRAAAEEPNPRVTAMRDLVGPQMPEEQFQSLLRYLNLLCLGDELRLDDLTSHGLAPAVAAKVMAAQEAGGDCPAASS